MILIIRLGFQDYEFALSTRPNKYIGDEENWNQAEDILTRLLNKKQPGKWILKAGDGAFYGYYIYYCEAINP